MAPSYNCQAINPICDIAITFESIYHKHLLIKDTMCDIQVWLWLNLRQNNIHKSFTRIFLSPISCFKADVCEFHQVVFAQVYGSGPERAFFNSPQTDVISPTRYHAEDRCSYRKIFYLENRIGNQVTNYSSTIWTHTANLLTNKLLLVRMHFQKHIFHQDTNAYQAWMISMHWKKCHRWNKRPY